MYSTRAVILIGITLLISSCYSYRPHVDKSGGKISSQPLASNSSQRLQVFIINPSEFPAEYKILRRANIYSISSDSTSLVKVRLKKMYCTSWMFCVTGPAVFIIFTVGQVPCRMPEGYSFALEEIQNGESRCIEYQLEIDKRIWFWDILSWRKSKKREIARALRLDRSKLSCTPSRFALDSTGMPWDKPSK